MSEARRLLGVDRVVSEVTAWGMENLCDYACAGVIDELTSERALEPAPGVRAETFGVFR
ncbi:MAG: hypothetical protein OXK76_17995 [Gammaproteobacteria bacterium]|nr:hypothetical protein [Gammaproteobacteria bacterium]